MVAMKKETETIPAGEMKNDIQSMSLMVFRDELTRLPNRTYFNQRLSMELEKARNVGEICSLILFELDNFREIKDCSGNSQGDSVLRGIASLLGGQIQTIQELERKKDVYARFGAEKFAIILPGMSLKGAYFIAQRLGKTLKNQRFPHAGKGPCNSVTASFGVVCFPAFGNTLEELLSRVEQALFLAKKNGKNRVEIYQPGY